jgi:hypothetical protein
MNTQELNGSTLSLWVFAPVSIALVLLTILAITLVARFAARFSHHPPPKVTEAVKTSSFLPV